MNTLIKTALCITAGAAVAAAVYINSKSTVEVITISNEDIEDLISDSEIITLQDMEDCVELMRMHYTSIDIDVPCYALREAVIDRFEECTGLNIVEYLGCEDYVNSWISGDYNAA